MNKFLLYILLLTGFISSGNLKGQSIVSKDSIVEDEEVNLVVPTDSVKLVVSNILTSELSDLDKEEVILQYVEEQQVDSTFLEEMVEELGEELTVEDYQKDILTKVKQRFTLKSQVQEIKEEINPVSEIEESVSEVKGEIETTVPTKVDSTTIQNITQEAKEKVKKDLLASVDGVTLTELTEEDLNNRLSDLLNNYDWDQLWQQYGVEDDAVKNNIKKEVGEYSNMTLDGLVTTSLLDVKLFDDLSPSQYKDKLKLQEDILQLNALQKEKLDLFQNWDFCKKGKNEFYDYLNNKKNINELLEKLNLYKKESEFKTEKKRYKKLIKAIKSKDKREQKVVKAIEENDYYKEIQKDYGDTLDYSEEMLSGDIGEDKMLKKVNEKANHEEVKYLLDQEYYNSKLTASHGNFTRVNAEVITAEALKGLDSTEAGGVLNEQNLKKLDRISEKKTKEEVGEVLLKESEKEGLMPKNTYFEGILGILKKDFTILNISPNIGYDISENFSAGLGASFQHTGDKNAFIITAIDYKVFTKYEFLKDRFFVQSEYVTLIPGLSYIKVKEGEYKYNDTFLIGGGINIRFNDKNAFSFSLYYNVNENIGTPAYESNVLARLGIKIF